VAENEAPDVDVVIAVHDPRRRVGRAVASVLDGGQVRTRVTVVCHNLPVEAIHESFARDGMDAAHPAVRFLAHTDGIPSPAGPFNRGIDAATGHYVSVMGSDDFLEPGAVRAWYELARRRSADAVIARVRRPSGAAVPTPVTRPWRTGTLDLVRDRLAYRSAPLGLVARDVVDALSLRMTEKVPSGEDISFVTRLWASGRVVLARGRPAYRIGEDAEDRVTVAPRPVDTEMLCVRAVLEAGWFVALPYDVRTSVVTKLLRIHVFGAVHNRQETPNWESGGREALQETAGLLVRAAPDAVRPLSVADRRLLDAVLNLSVPTEELIDRSVARRRFGRPETLVPRDWRAVLHREAPLRFMTASLLASR